MQHSTSSTPQFIAPPEQAPSDATMRIDSFTPPRITGFTTPTSSTFSEDSLPEYPDTPADEDGHDNDSTMEVTPTATYAAPTSVPSRPESRSSTLSGVSTTAVKDGIEGRRVHQPPDAFLSSLMSAYNQPQSHHRHHQHHRKTPSATSEPAVGDSQPPLSRSSSYTSSTSSYTTDSLGAASYAATAVTPTTTTATDDFPAAPPAPAGQIASG
ncbi:hypothetical protein BZA70DRAFT_264587 [Myxozyma melibiosi]|uniref:Uncharacterized protein n=1 Tax=Myxozyma melibiosi TaxID=54550 RepID=A0ABR1FBG8_9ASCO